MAASGVSFCAHCRTAHSQCGPPCRTPRRGHGTPAHISTHWLHTLHRGGPHADRPTCWSILSSAESVKAWSSYVNSSLQHTREGNTSSLPSSLLHFPLSPPLPSPSPSPRLNGHSSHPRNDNGVSNNQRHAKCRLASALTRRSLATERSACPAPDQALWSSSSSPETLHSER